MRHTLIPFLFMGICAEAAALEVPDTCPPKPVDEESAIALASTWFEKGQKHVEAKEYGAAVDAYACSLRMVEHQDTLYNAFKSALLAKEHDTAVELGVRILEVSTDEQAKTEARALLAAAPPLPQEPKQQPGPESKVPENAEGATADGAATTQAPVFSTNRSAVWKAGVNSFIVGGAGLVVGAVLQGLTGQAQQTTAETRDYAKYVDAKRDIDSFQNGAIAAFVAGGVFLGAGIVLFLMDAKRQDEPRLAVVPNGSGLFVRGAF